MKTLMTVLAIAILLNACSSAYERGEPLVAADEMKAGPGIFSGQKGGFYLVGGEEKDSSAGSVSKMNLDETSSAIEDRIEQLKRDQKELEALKLEVDKKLRN